MAPKLVDYLLDEPVESGSCGHRARTIGGPALILFVQLPPEATVGV